MVDITTHTATAGRSSSIPSFRASHHKLLPIHLNNNSLLIALFSFVLGCIVASTWVAHMQVTRMDAAAAVPLPTTELRSLVASAAAHHHPSHNSTTTSNCPTGSNNILSNLRILVVLVAFDFSQQPHLEEVLEGYHDIACQTGVQQLDVIIHATVAWPVTLIDMLSARLLHASYPYCGDRFTITVSLQPKSLRLFLVDIHRTVFYERLDQYDLFLYSEDDIRVTPTTVATYWYETQQLRELTTSNHKYNIGIVRYEYNYPANVIIDDKTRHATVNVTRVYWEHSSSQRPVIGNTVHGLDASSATQQQQQHKQQHTQAISDRYLTMQNHHQGMFLATRELLEAWRDDPQCRFDQARRRPGKNQPTEGTQRVWMSSQMLYGGRHCNVQQVLPKHAFDALTVWHLPNKNYRRVGKYRNRTFSDGSESFAIYGQLLTAMELHLAIVKEWPPLPQVPMYRGIRMEDHVTKPRDRTPLLERRLREYQAYVERGGVLSIAERSQTTQVLMEEA